MATSTFQPLARPCAVIRCNPLDYEKDHRLFALVRILESTGVFQEVKGVELLRTMHDRIWDRRPYDATTPVSAINDMPWPYQKEDALAAVVVSSASDARPTIIQTPDELLWIANSYNSWDDGKLDSELYLRFDKYVNRLPVGASLHRFKEGHTLDYNETVWGPDLRLHVRSTAVILRVCIRSVLTPPRMVLESMTDRWHGAYARAGAPWAKAVLQKYRERHGSDELCAPGYWCGLSGEEFSDGYYDGFLVMGALLDRTFPWHEKDPVVAQLYLYAHFRNRNEAQIKIDQSFFRPYFKGRRTPIFDYDAALCNYKILGDPHSYTYSLAAPVPYDAQAVRWWLKLEGFADGDYHREAIMPEMETWRDWNISTLALITPMGRACHRGELNVVQWLEQHVDVRAPAATSARACTGMTALHFAVLGGHLSVCQWLVARGADVTACTAQGLTPLRVACVAMHLEVCKWLDDNVAPTFADLTHALDERSYDFGLHLIQKDEDGSARRAVCQWLLLAGVAETPEQKRFLLDHHPEMLLNDRVAGTKSLVAEALEVHGLFYGAFLQGAVVVPAAQRRVQSKVCRLPMLPTAALQRVSSFLSVPRGRQLRCARQLHELSIKYQAFWAIYKTT